MRKRKEINTTIEAEDQEFQSCLIQTTNSTTEALLDRRTKLGRESKLINRKCGKYIASKLKIKRPRK